MSLTLIIHLLRVKNLSTFLNKFLFSSSFCILKFEASMVCKIEHPCVLYKTLPLNLSMQFKFQIANISIQFIDFCYLIIQYSTEELNVSKS